MMHKAWCSIEEVPYCFPRSSIKFQGHTGQKNRRFWPKLSVSRLWLQFQFTDGFEMIHKAWCSIGEVPFYLLRSYIKLLRSHGLKNRRFGSNLSKITRPVAVIKSLRFALFLHMLDAGYRVTLFQCAITFPFYGIRYFHLTKYECFPLDLSC